MYSFSFSNGRLIKINTSGLGTLVRFQKNDPFFETIQIGALAYADDLALIFNPEDT